MSTGHLPAKTERDDLPRRCNLSRVWPAQMLRGGGRFTYLEVLLAVALLAAGLAMTLGLLAAARERTLRAERSWARQHLLAQAAEFHLLAGPKAAPPQDLLTEGYGVRCELERLESANGEDPLLYQLPNAWLPAVFHFTLMDRNGNALDTLDVEKWVREEDR